MPSSPIAAIALLVAATTAAPAPTPSPAPPSVALVAGLRGFGDHGLNDEARAGLDACGRARGIRVVSVAPDSADDAAAKLVLYATENFDRIIGVGAQLAPGVRTAAQRFVKTQFAVVDAAVDEPNVESVVFEVEQSSYLAGALAALVAHGRHVAFVGAEASAPVLAYQSGFIAGVRSIVPRAAVAVKYAGSFRDASAARAAARALYDGGAAVIFAVAGPAGLGVIDEARARKGVYTIGVDANQDGIAPGVVLTSVVKHVAPVVARLCEETASEKPASGVTAVGLAAGAVGLTPFAYTKRVIGPATLARVDRIRAAIVAGKILPPTTLEQLAAFKPVPVR